PGAYDPLASGPSNLGPSNPDLLAQIDRRRTRIAKAESVAPSAVPPDAVTASGSGLDPYISPAYAAIQVDRVARANGLPPATVTDLVGDNTHDRLLGYLGEPKVNVLELNIAVRAATAGLRH
ncbi:MAG: potassium-transporting ATPase subunit C, partial [Actinomycetia bacterium]|nr:potassium-transporting ATPase subunit C [Actinomycetes bacterium]